MLLIFGCTAMQRASLYHFKSSMATMETNVENSPGWRRLKQTTYSPSVLTLTKLLWMHLAPPFAFRWNMI